MWRPTYRLLCVALVPLPLLTTAFLKPTAAVSDAAQQSRNATKDHDAAEDDDGDGDEKEGKDPCRKALRPGERAEQLRQECENGSSSGIARGDFNGDGIGDLAIGVPFEDIADADGGTIQDAGGVNIIYGSATGLNSEAGPSDQFLGYAQTNGRAGTALASGDFNGDGFSDLAVGAPFDDVPPGTTSTDVPFVISNIADGSSNTIDFSESIPPARSRRSFRTPAACTSFTALPPDSIRSRGKRSTSGRFSGTCRARATSSARHWHGATSMATDSAISPLGFQVTTCKRARWAFCTAVPSVCARRIDSANGVSCGRRTAPASLDVAEAGDRFGATLAGGEFGMSSLASDLAIGVPGEDLTVTRLCRQSQHHAERSRRWGRQRACMGPTRPPLHAAFRPTQPVLESGQPANRGQW